MTRLHFVDGRITFAASRSIIPMYRRDYAEWAVPAAAPYALGNTGDYARLDGIRIQEVWESALAAVPLGGRQAHRGRKRCAFFLVNMSTLCARR